MATAISVRNLIFEYPAKRALHGVTFEIESGSVTAMVGPNGAGKTTLLRCLAALEMPFSGEVSIGGILTEDDPRAVHSKVGYLSDFFGLYSELTVRQCLLHMAALHEIDSSQIPLRISEMASALDLEALLQLKASTLSRGQKQRLAIAQAIIHKPQVLLLDEPAAGLDPEARHGLSTLINKLRSEGMTILVSSHILSELEDYSNAMLTVSAGRIVAHEKLSSRQDSQQWTIEIELLAEDERIYQFLKESVEFEIVGESGALITLTTRANREKHCQLLAQIINSGFKVCSFARQQQSMQSLYLSQISKPELSSDKP